MKQKQLLTAFLLCGLIFAALSPAAALASAAPETSQLSGLVSDISGNGFLLADAELGDVFLSVDPSTVLEGVLAEKPLAQGMYVMVRYNGQLSRSHPPTAHADRLGCYPLEGSAAQVSEGEILLSGDAVFGDVVVRFPDAMPHIIPGIPLTVYYDGAMTMSFPGKVNARHVAIPVVHGTIRSAGTDGFVLAADDGNAFFVRLSDAALLPTDWAERSVTGKQVVVYYSSIQEGNLLTALAVEMPTAEALPAEATDDETADELTDADIPSDENPSELPTPTPPSETEETPPPVVAEPAPLPLEATPAPPEAGA